MKEQSVLDLFTIARVCHRDTVGLGTTGEEKLWAEDCTLGWYDLWQGEEIREQIVLL